jgi:hypothetical protein
MFPMTKLSANTYSHRILEEWLNILFQYVFRTIKYAHFKSVLAAFLVLVTWLLIWLKWPVLPWPESWENPASGPLAASPAPITAGTNTNCRANYKCRLIPVETVTALLKNGSTTSLPRHEKLSHQNDFSRICFAGCPRCRFEPIGRSSQG